jgi:glycine oxidase
MSGAPIRIVGAGVAGLACALTLAERGVAVEVVDRGERLGARSCSWYAGGMLAPWCEAESAEEPVVRLGIEALSWWRERHPGTLSLGSLVIAPDRDLGEITRFSRRTTRFEWADADRVAELEPDLAGRFRKALFFPDEAHLDPRAALASLARALAARGVPLRFGTEAEGLPPAPMTVDCRGFAARDALPDLRGVKGEMVVVRTPEVKISRPVRMLHPRFPLYIVPRGEGVYMIGATMIESEERGRVTLRSAMELLGAAYALHPAFAEAEILELGADVRPAFPDNLPRVRRHGRTLYANGLFRHGFLLSPALARMTADAVLDPGHVPELMDEDHGERRSA